MTRKRKPTSLAIAFFCLASLVVASDPNNEYVTFCKSDQLSCHSLCSSINGHFVTLGHFNNESTVRGFMCLQDRIIKCASDEDCTAN